MHQQQGEESQDSSGLQRCSEEEAERRRYMDQRREDLRRVHQSMAGMHRADAMDSRDATGQYHAMELRSSAGLPPAEGGTHRGKGPRNYRRSDERIREDVCERLREDPRLDASGIDVEVRNREVTLSGTVTDRQSRRRAEELSEGVSGLAHVENRIRVG